MLNGMFRIEFQREGFLREALSPMRGMHLKIEIAQLELSDLCRNRQIFNIGSSPNIAARGWLVLKSISIFHGRTSYSQGA
jgi:hypothetical protein